MVMPQIPGKSSDPLFYQAGGLLGTGSSTRGQGATGGFPAAGGFGGGGGGSIDDLLPTAASVPGTRGRSGPPVFGGDQSNDPVLQALPKELRGKYIELITQYPERQEQFAELLAKKDLKGIIQLLEELSASAPSKKAPGKGTGVAKAAGGGGGGGGITYSAAAQPAKPAADPKKADPAKPADTKKPDATGVKLFNASTSKLLSAHALDAVPAFLKKAFEQGANSKNPDFIKAFADGQITPDEVRTLPYKVAADGKALAHTRDTALSAGYFATANASLDEALKKATTPEQKAALTDMKAIYTAFQGASAKTGGIPVSEAAMQRLLADGKVDPKNIRPDTVVPGMYGMTKDKDGKEVGFKMVGANGENFTIQLPTEKNGTATFTAIEARNVDGKGNDFQVNATVKDTNGDGHGDTVQAYTVDCFDSSGKAYEATVKEENGKSVLIISEKTYTPESPPPAESNWVAKKDGEGKFVAWAYEDQYGDRAAFGNFDGKPGLDMSTDFSKEIIEGKVDFTGILGGTFDKADEFERAMHPEGGGTPATFEAVSAAVTTSEKSPMETTLAQYTVPASEGPGGNPPVDANPSPPPAAPAETSPAPPEAAL